MPTKIRHSGEENTTTLENARLAIEQDPIYLWNESQERRYWDEMYKIIVVSTSLEVCEALLRNEKVPRSRLDRKWLKAYGL